MSSFDLYPPQFPLPGCSAWGEDDYGLFISFELEDVRQDFRWLPPGRFLMGSPEDEAGRFDDEDLHPVVLTRGFWLGDTAVTQAWWQAVMRDNPSRFKGEERPVERVSWDGVQVFAAKLNELFPGVVWSLPTEAQWEYACRAGSRTAYSWGDEIDKEKANYADAGHKGTVEVKAYPANRWGLYQMHGNVWEWCHDQKVEHLGYQLVVDPVGSSGGRERVFRGGSWVDDGRFLRSAYRDWRGPGGRLDSLGFRLSPGHELRPAEDE